MGKPTPASHSSTLSSKLLLMIHDASESLLAREEADRISSELSNGPRGSSSGSRKRKRVEGGLGGGVLAELAEDLDVDDERAKALVSALVRHIRLKRRPPPPNPSLLVRPSSNIDHLLSRSSRLEPSSSSSRPRSLLPQPRSGPSSSSATTAADLAGRLGSTASSRRFLSSSHRPHFRTHSPDFDHYTTFEATEFRNFSSPPRSTAAATTSHSTMILPSDDSFVFGDGAEENDDQQQPPHLPPQSPSWQPAEELHIPPEELASYRAMRAQFYSDQAREDPPSQPRRRHPNLHHNLASPSFFAHSSYRTRPDTNNDDGPGLFETFPVLDARALGFGPSRRRRYEEEDDDASGSESENGEGGNNEFDINNGELFQSLVRGAMSVMGDGLEGSGSGRREEAGEEVEIEEERFMTRAERRRRVPQISISLSPPPPGSGSGSGTGGSRWGPREGDDEDV